MASSLLIKGGTVVTMGSAGVIEANILIEDSRISRVGSNVDKAAERTIDATDKVIIPGMIQTHVHLSQVAFRGMADDLELLDWLRERTWPLEAAHDHETAYYSGVLGCMEMIRSGTTCIADMGSIQNADADAQAMYDMGIRGKFGKAMTDYGELPPELGDLPAAFEETTSESIDASMALLRDWHGRDDGRIQYLFAPRGLLSSSDEMLLETKRLADEYGTGVHTHACENRTETQRVKEQRGLTEIRYLHKLGLTGPNLMLAHCVWVDEEDMDILAQTKSKVLHCPSTNLKLASGIAPIPEMLERGIHVSIGADGAPCNNNLDAFVEMRAAALIQKGRLLSPTVMPAPTVFELVTLQGAKALGLEDEIGSLEPGKKADLVILDFDRPHSVPHADVYSTLVYSAGRENVETVIIDGKLLYEGGHFTRFDEGDVLSKCKGASRELLARAGLAT